jgi:hypothetical protein
MRVGGVILAGLAVVGAYALGSHNADPPKPASPIFLVESPASQPRQKAPEPKRSISSLSPPSDPKPRAATQEPTVKEHRIDKKAVLTAAAIAALIVAASRSAYYSTGRPCACPDDRMRNGRRCGSRSAYSRPGGAAPLCFPSDVSAEMIAEYRRRSAAR